MRLWYREMGGKAREMGGQVREIGVFPFGKLSKLKSAAQEVK
jgi:hypothetical protein